MNKPRKLSAAIGLVLASATPLLNAAEIQEITVVSGHLEETIPMDLSRYGNRVEIVTSNQITQQGYTDLGQTLQMLVPGLHLTQKNGAFDYFDASLQGSRNSEILFLIDGVRVTNRLYNGTSPDTIPVHMIERIEVLKGGQGIFYGTQSVGGVVNIVTKSFSNDSDGAIGTGINSNDGHNVNAYYRTSVGDHQFVAYASKDVADGYTPYRREDIQASATDAERGYDVASAGLKYAWNISDSSRLSLQYQRTDAELDFAQPYLNNNTVNDRQEEIFTLKYDLQLNENIELFVKAYQHNWDTDYTRIYNELDGSGMLTGGTVVRNDASYWGYEDRGFNAMAKINYGGPFESILGFDQQRFSAEDDVWRIGRQEEKVNAPFAQIRTTNELFEDTSLALGVRNNRASNMEDSTVWNLSGRHNFTDSLYIQGNIGTSFRMPDAEALFLNEYYDDNNDGIPDGGWFAIGNPNLEPEESENINLSIGGSFNKLSYEVIAFKRDITNYIDSYVPLTIAGVVGESFVNSNDEVNMDGYELISSLALTDSISTNFSYTYTQAKFNDAGPQLASIPKSEAKFQANYQKPGAPYGVSLAMNYVGDVNARRGATRGNYTVSDVSAFYNLGNQQQHRLSLRIQNLSDKEYATRIDRGSLDSDGSSYLYSNLGMERTLHLSYTYQF